MKSFDLLRRMQRIYANRTKHSNFHERNDRNMKNPLYYQATEYDCGPTSMLNAISFLFEREEIPPIIIKNIMAYCLDKYDDEGEICKGGTSGIAMKYLSDWLNRYHKISNFPLSCEYITGEEVEMTRDSKIIKCLANGGAAVLHVWFECWHYVLLTGADENHVTLFDPYFYDEPFENANIEVIHDAPTRMNRRVTYEILNVQGDEFYAMGPKETRKVVLLYNLNSKG